MNTISKLAAIPALFFLLSGQAYSETANKRCKTYDWKPGDIISVEASLYKQTHITLPEAAMDVLWGPKEMWDTDSVENHLFVTPKNPTPQGKDTTATAVGASRNVYEFEFTRVDNLRIHCVVLNANGGLIKRQAWNAKDAQAESQIQLLQQQLAKANIEKAQMGEETKRQAQEAIKSYRTSITSKYEWSNGSGWFAQKEAIDSVYDDGRFTYIRLANDERGIMSILAEIDGKTEILEKVYDASKREYRIAGIYPKFIMRAGNSELVVNRKG